MPFEILPTPRFARNWEPPPPRRQRPSLPPPPPPPPPQPQTIIVGVKDWRKNGKYLYNELLLWIPNLPLDFVTRDSVRIYSTDQDLVTDVIFDPTKFWRDLPSRNRRGQLNPTGKVHNLNRPKVSFSPPQDIPLVGDAPPPPRDLNDPGNMPKRIRETSAYLQHMYHFNPANQSRKSGKSRKKRKSRRHSSRRRSKRSSRRK